MEALLLVDLIEIYTRFGNLFEECKYNHSGVRSVLGQFHIDMTAVQFIIILTSKAPTSSHNYTNYYPTSTAQSDNPTEIPRTANVGRPASTCRQWQQLVRTINV